MGPAVGVEHGFGGDRSIARLLAQGLVLLHNGSVKISRLDCQLTLVVSRFVTVRPANLSGGLLKGLVFLLIDVLLAGKLYF